MKSIVLIVKQVMKMLKGQLKMNLWTLLTVSYAANGKCNFGLFLTNTLKFANNVFNIWKSMEIKLIQKHDAPFAEQLSKTYLWIITKFLLNFNFEINKFFSPSATYNKNGNIINRQWELKQIWFYSQPLLETKKNWDFGIISHLKGK